MYKPSSKVGDIFMQRGPRSTSCTSFRVIVDYLIKFTTGRFHRWSTSDIGVSVIDVKECPFNETSLSALF